VEITADIGAVLVARLRWEMTQRKGTSAEEEKTKERRSGLARGHREPSSAYAPSSSSCSRIELDDNLTGNRIV